MDNSQRQEMALLLGDRFDLDEHEVRTGGSGKWFVYIKREAIIYRLDSVAPMDWHTKIVSTVRIDDRVEATMEMTIAGVTRSFNGVAEDNRRKATDGKPEVLFPLMTAKSAATDAFKRVASMFGIGLYLQGCDTIKASNKESALKSFAHWFNPNNGNNTPQQQQSSNGKSGTVWTEGRINKLFHWWFEEHKLTAKDVIRLAGVTEMYNSKQWAKYDTNQDASAAIQKAFQAELDIDAEQALSDPAEQYYDSSDDQTAEKSQSISNGYDDTFHFMSYIGIHSNLQFSTHEPGAKHNTVAICFGGRGAIKKWGGAELCEQLNLAQYDKIKGKATVSDFIPMTVPIEFYFADDQTNSGFDFKLTGIKGDPVIPF